MRLPSVTECFIALGNSFLFMVIASFIPWGQQGYYVADTLALLSIFGCVASILILGYGHLYPWLRRAMRLPPL